MQDKKNKKTSILMYSIIVILCSIIFCTCYGVAILNPFNTNWLMYGGDLTQHYLGWLGFRNGNWTFPIGLSNQLSYPYNISVLFTDSIPLLAIPFKLLSNILPTNFQYFGLYGILCFILQGIFTAKIMKHFSNSKIIIVLTSCLFCLTPIFIYRMYYHTSLASHWILLMALEPLFAYKEYYEKHNLYKSIFVLSFLSSLIHPYLILMVGIIIIGICIQDTIIYKRIWASAKYLLLFISVSICVLFIIGAFSSKLQFEDIGLGEFSMNINGFFNQIYFPFKTAFNGQYEGFSYLGLGIFLLIIISLFFIKKIINKKNLIRIISISSIFIISYIIALSPVITFGDKVLFTINYPNFIIKLLSTFRATGRISWICVYVIMICSNIIILKYMDKEFAIAFLIFAIVLQIIDVAPILRERYIICNYTNYDNTLKDTNFWHKISTNKSIKHIVYTQIPDDRKAIYDFAYFALNNNKTINYFYFARKFDLGVDKKNLLNISDNTLFVFFKDSLSCIENRLYCYYIDNYLIGYIHPILQNK